MLRNISETYAHDVKREPIAYLSLRPNPLRDGHYLLSATRFEYEAKGAEKVRDIRALDECNNETEVFGPSTDDTFLSYYGYRPGNFNSRVTPILNSHIGAPVLWIFCCLCAV